MGRCRECYIGALKVVANLRGARATPQSICQLSQSECACAIYVGGLLQLLFGVRGARWDKRKEIVDAMNEHWSRPLSHEVPAGNRLLLDGDGAYWR